MVCLKFGLFNWENVIHITMCTFIWSELVCAVCMRQNEVMIRIVYLVCLRKQWIGFLWQGFKMCMEIWQSYRPAKERRNFTAFSIHTKESCKMFLSTVKCLVFVCSVHMHICKCFFRTYLIFALFVVSSISYKIILVNFHPLLHKSLLK